MRVCPWINLALCSWLLLPAAASAQGGGTGLEEMVSVPPDELTTGSSSKRLDVGVTWGAQIGVPISLDVDRSVVKPGVDLSIFVGADFGFFTIGGTPGVMWIPINVDGFVVDGSVLSGRSPVTRIFISIPEFRVQIPDLNVVLPYISGAFDINLWSFRDKITGCGFYYCDADQGFRFTPGFTGRAGLAFEVTNEIYIDLGLRYSLSGKGQFFEQVRWWLTPYVGVLFRPRPR